MIIDWFVYFGVDYWIDLEVRFKLWFAITD